MRHHPSLDQVKADLLNIFKGINESERAKREAYLAARHRKARQTIEQLQEKKHLQDTISAGWDAEVH